MFACDAANTGRVAEKFRLPDHDFFIAT